MGKPHERTGQRLVVAPDNSIRAKTRQVDEAAAPELPRVGWREHSPHPDRDDEGRKGAERSPPFFFEYKEEDEGAGDELDTSGKTDQHASIPRGDDENVQDDKGDEHQVDLSEEDISRERFESQTGQSNPPCVHQGQAKAHSAHRPDDQVARKGEARTHPRSW